MQAAGWVEKSVEKFD